MPRVAPLLLASVAVSLATTLAGAQEHRYVFAERQALALDSSRIAVRASDRPRAVIEKVLARVAIDAADLEPWPIRGWWIAAVPERDRTFARVRSLVARLAREATLDFVAPIFVGEDGGALFPAGDVLVGFDPELGTRFARAALRRRTELAIVEQRWAQMPGAWRLACREHDGFVALRAANALALAPGVLFAEADMIYTGTGSYMPNDALFGSCWGLNNTGQVGGYVADVDVDAPEAWDLTLGDPSVRIAVIDVGVEHTHADLNALPGVDVTTDQSPDGDPFNACDNHGTLIAGCVSAKIDNGLGIVGSAPGCKVFGVRALIAMPQCNFTWTTSTTWVVAALSAAQQLGARVTNCSNGLMAAASVATKYQQLHDAGIVHFASVGNASSTAMHYPSTLSTVNGVSAVAPDGTLAGFSNYGQGLDLSAPGVDIPCTDRSGGAGIAPNDYATVSGTSEGAPCAAGIAALVLSRNPDLNASQVDQVLRASATDLGAPGYDVQFGHGMVNARAALDLAGTGCPTPIVECTALANTSGGAASITFSGTTSVIADDLVLVVNGCPSFANNRFIFGTASTQLAFGTGFLCVAPPHNALPVNATNSSGDAQRDVPVAAFGMHSGQTFWFQNVYRDPTAAGSTFNTSAALRVTFCP